METFIKRKNNFGPITVTFSLKSEQDVIDLMVAMEDAVTDSMKREKSQDCPAYRYRPVLRELSKKLRKWVTP